MRKGLKKEYPPPKILLKSDIQTITQSPRNTSTWEINSSHQFRYTYLLLSLNIPVP